MTGHRSIRNLGTLSLRMELPFRWFRAALDWCVARFSAADHPVRPRFSVALQVAAPALHLPAVRSLAVMARTRFPDSSFCLFLLAFARTGSSSRSIYRIPCPQFLSANSLSLYRTDRK